jgi:hypothetical protein
MARRTHDEKADLRRIVLQLFDEGDPVFMKAMTDVVEDIGMARAMKRALRSPVVPVDEAMAILREMCRERNSSRRLQARSSSTHRAGGIPRGSTSHRKRHIRSRAA